MGLMIDMARFAAAVVLAEARPEGSDGTKTEIPTTLPPVVLFPPTPGPTPCLWRSGLSNVRGSLIPNLQTIADKGISEGHLENCHDKNLCLKLPPQRVSSSGFELNRIKFYFSPGNTTVDVDLEFERVATGDGCTTLKLVRTEYKFSKPALAAVNIEAKLDVRSLTAGGLLELMDKANIGPYDSKAANCSLATGDLVVPVVIAFDKLTISSPKSSDVRMDLSIINPDYEEKKGWATYSFGILPFNCNSTRDGKVVGKYLGSELDGKMECREIETGNNTSLAFTRWMLGKNTYAKVLKETGGNPVAAMTVLTNGVMGLGAKDKNYSWDMWAREENKLGRNYLLWEKATASK